MESDVVYKARKNTVLDTVLAGVVPHRVPFVEFGISHQHISKVLGDRSITSSDKLSVENYVEFINCVGIDVLYSNCLWKVGRVYKKSSDGKSHYVDGSIKTRNDFKKIVPPDITKLTQRAKELSIAAKENHTAFVLGVSTPYKLAKAAVGYQDFLIKTVDDMDFVLDLEDHLASHAQEILKKCLEYDVSAIMIPGDMCGKHGPLLAPDTIAKLWIETTNEFIRPAKELGIPVILHVDGDFSGIMDVLMAIEPDAIHPFEVCGNLDIYKAKQEIGDRVTLMGNIDLSGVLSFGSAEQVRKSVRKHIEKLAPNGRYVCGSSHEISDSVPYENFIAMAETIRDFGEYC